MLTKHFQLLAVGVSFLLWLSLSNAEERRSNPPNTALVQSAKATLAATLATYEEGVQAPWRTTVEDVYRWSRRLMEAELKSDSAGKRPREEHLKRMRELLKRVEADSKVGAIGGNTIELMGTKFFIAEAEFDIEESKPAE